MKSSVPKKEREGKKENKGGKIISKIKADSKHNWYEGFISSHLRNNVLKLPQRASRNEESKL